MGKKIDEKMKVSCSELEPIRSNWFKSLPMGGAFITGSYAYGKPNFESDVDLVVRCTMDVIDKLMLKGTQKEGSSLAAELYPGSICLYFGKLNLICCPDDTVYDVWRQGTKELMLIRPVTREQAVRHFAALREKAGVVPKTIKK